MDRSIRKPAGSSLCFSNRPALPSGLSTPDHMTANSSHSAVVDLDIQKNGGRIAHNASIQLHVGKQGAVCLTPFHGPFPFLGVPQDRSLVEVPVVPQWFAGSWLWGIQEHLKPLLFLRS